MIDELDVCSAWDLGANVGRFSRLVSARGVPTIAWDIDPACVEANYQQVKTSGEPGLLPLLQDLTNPSGGIGWAGLERASLAERGPVDLVLALGLIHHLVIGNNVPVARVARYFSTLCRYLIVEFVPKEDSQVRLLLATREDVFDDYRIEAFSAALSECFRIDRQVPIAGTRRTLFLATSKARP
jgi:ribosomal protein L11 methylase PrmA